MGYSPIPIMTLSKRPAIPKWPEFGITPADESTLERWSYWPGMNVGVCGGVGGKIVIADLDHNIDGLHEKIKSILPPSPVGKTGAIGESWFYQFNGQKSQGFSKDGQRVLDILSQGRQTVIPPSIHPNGHPYRWITKQTLEDTPSYELPNISIQHLHEIAALFKSQPILHVPEPRHTEVYADTTTEEIAAALEYIDAEDYSSWINVGMCLKDKLRQKGFQLWDNWSAKSQKYKQSEMQTKWNSFKGSGLTIASIFFTAMDSGYINTPSEFLDAVYEDFELDGKKTGYSKPETVAATVITEIEKPKKTDLVTFPSELLKAPGLPGHIAEFINRTSLMPQPVLALAASLAAAGSLMGRKVRGDTNVRTNIYILGLAPSGSGKDHARTIIKRMFHDTGLGKLELGVPASSAGLVSALQASGEGRGIVLWDEFGRVLKQIMGPKAGTHERDIVTAMMELFSSSQSIYMGKSYANHDGKKPSKPIDQPCLSIYGTSVPSHFYDSLSGSDAIDGFLSRWLLFESKDYTMEEEDPELAFSAVPQAMIDLCKKWKEMPFNSDVNKGNLDDAVRVVPKLIPCSPQASVHLKAFATDTRKSAMKKELSGDITGSIWSRAGEHARRLALIGCEGDVIELKVAEWAVKLAKNCCDYMSYAINDYVSSSELESQTKRVLRYVRDRKSAGDGWISRAELTRAFQAIQARTRNEILSSLAERGELIEERHAGSGRPKIRYKAT